MKSFRQFCAALVLTLVICVSAFAGDISCPGIAAPGEMGTPGVATPGDMNSPPRMQSSPEAAAGEVQTPGIALLLFAIDLLV